MPEGMMHLVGAIADNTVSIVVIAYFMFRDYKFMGELQKTLQSLVDTVGVLKIFVAKDSE